MPTRDRIYIGHQSRRNKGSIYKLGWAVKSCASFVLISIFLYASTTAAVLSFAYLTDNQSLLPLIMYLHRYFRMACILVLMVMALLFTYTLLAILLCSIWGDDSRD